MVAKTISDLKNIAICLVFSTILPWKLRMFLDHFIESCQDSSNSVVGSTLIVLRVARGKFLYEVSHCIFAWKSIGKKYYYHVGGIRMHAL